MPFGRKLARDAGGSEEEYEDAKVERNWSAYSFIQSVKRNRLNAKTADKLINISSSWAERNWSTYSFIQSVKKNRLNAKKAYKLVYIHANTRLISRIPANSSLEESSLKLEELRCKYLEENYGDDEPTVDADEETPATKK
jgi:hypothetical protein